MQKYFFYLNLNKCIDANVVLLKFISVLLIFCIIDKMTINLSSNFT